MTNAMTLTVLGCSGSYAGPAGACSGYLVRCGETSIWLDTGPGTVANFQRHVPLTEVSAIVVSHEHPDHCGELAVLYNAYKWYEHRALIPVYATAGVRRIVTASCQTTDDVFDWTIIADGDTASIGPVDLRFERTDHSVETMATRLDHDGRSMVYTADTGPAWDLGTFAKDVDVLLGEGTTLFADHHPEVPHLSARHLGDAAGAAGAGRLLVTHIDPRADVALHVEEARAAFGGPTEAAVIHETYEI